MSQDCKINIRTPLILWNVALVEYELQILNQELSASKLQLLLEKYKKNIIINITAIINFEIFNKNKVR